MRWCRAIRRFSNVRGEALAPAKLNLILHVTGRRADGYHTLESLVTFLDLADRLRVEPCALLTLETSGPFAAGAGAAEDNLMLKAARLLAGEAGTAQGAALRLDKQIPAGAGLGGASADAAAALRLLNDFWQCGLDRSALARLALQLGADVPMCLDSRPVIARGIGELLEPVALPQLHLVLVYPNRPLATAQVYAALKRKEPAPHAAIEDYLAGSNDLQRAAIALMPEIAEMLLALETAPVTPQAARMSGSGSCCFAIMENADEAKLLAAHLARQYPGWWVKVAKSA
jgi:4-diphosphocytidyl-2-C-methyl-D-erythritol kinase